MVQAARMADLGDQSAVSGMGFTVAEDWDELPLEIRMRFAAPPTEAFVLNKDLVRSTEDGRPKAIHFLLLVTDRDAPPRFVAKTVTRSDFRHWGEEPTLRPFGWAVLIGFSIAAVCSLLLLITLRTIVRPLETLRTWTTSLSAENLHESPPTFQYREFTDLAEVVGSSLKSVRDGLDKEQEFLRYASHELRSPLATMRGNVDLLAKLETDPQRPQQAIVQRMDRAVTTMTQLIQTLLWLQRDEHDRFENDDVALDELVREVVDEMSYLVRGKDIDLQVSTTPYMLPAPRSACRIVISNLVRNAYQHTTGGTIVIAQVDATLVVENENGESTPGESNELGFGLGIRLIEKVSTQFGWQFSTSKASNGFTARLEFPDSNELES